MHLAAADSFSAFAIFMRADWVVKLVMLGLALASLWSWAVIIDKTIRLSSLNRQANRFEDQVANRPPLTLRVALNLPVQGRGHVLDLKIRHGMLLA